MDLHHVISGTGEPLLLIQGMSGTHLSWGEPFLAALRDDFEIVAYDHRGIGLSPAVTDPFTIAELADDAAALMDRLGWDTAHVLGISMGGMVAQEFALRHGARVRTLTLGCTYCGGPGSQTAPLPTIQKLGVAMTSGDRDVAIKVGYECNVSAAFRADPAHFEAFRAMAYAAPVKIATIMLQMQAIAAFDVQARLGEITQPTLVLHGTEDQMLPPGNAELIASKLPSVELQLWEDVGHMFWWEQPQRSAEAIKAHALR